MKQRYSILIVVILVLIISALIYLPLVHQFGYYNDDWYTMYAARVAGPQVFEKIYSIDRPGRAWIMIPLFLLFKGNPFYYGLSAFLLRMFGSFCFLYLLNCLWPRSKKTNSIASILFLVYPGFLSQPNAIDFQSHLIGIALAFLSLSWMIKAFRAHNMPVKIFFWILSVFAGWGYLSQMEYYIGFEAVRLAIVFLFAWRNNPSVWRAVFYASQKWLPYFIISLFYLGWRIFIFENDRTTTDVSLQIGRLTSDTLETLYTWSINLLQSSLNVLVLAWGVPLSNLAFSMGLKEKLTGLVYAVVCVFLFLFAHKLIRKGNEVDEHDDTNWGREIVLLGFAWLILGLLPVIIANRGVVYPLFSRYGLVSSGGAILLLITFLYRIPLRTRSWILAFLIFAASLTHYANNLIYARSSNAMRGFWWQVSWRIPQMEDGTTVVAHYPGDSLRETSFIWGPANQVYYPEQLEGKGVRPGVYALLLNQTTVLKVVTQQPSYTDPYNIVLTYPNPRQILVLSQPSFAACVHVINGYQPEYSVQDRSEILVIGTFSKANRVMMDGPFHTPPAFLFGSEPPHGWCYYYQKADLARQRGEWEQVLEFGEQAFGQGLEPGDLIEWMPFLQAYAWEGDVVRLRELSPRIAKEPFISQQVCQILHSMPNLTADITEIIQDFYCQ